MHKTTLYSADIKCTQCVVNDCINLNSEQTIVRNGTKLKSGYDVQTLWYYNFDIILLQQAINVTFLTMFCLFRCMSIFVCFLDHKVNIEV